MVFNFFKQQYLFNKRNDGDVEIVSGETHIFIPEMYNVLCLSSVSP